MSDAFRALYLNPGIDLGGAEHSLLLLLGEVRVRGIEPVVVSFGNGRFLERVTAMGIRGLSLELGRSARRSSRYRMNPLAIAQSLAASVPAAARLASLARQEQVGLIHTNGAKAHLIGGLAGRLVGVPVVWHLRDFPPPGLAGALFVRAAGWLPAAIIANSRATASAYGRPGTRAVVVPNPIDLPRFTDGRSSSAVREALGVPPGVPLVAQIAHLTPWKGHELFLEVAQLLLDRHPDARFLVVGGAIYETDGHSGYAEALRQRARALGVEKQVSFLGARDDVPDILRALDVLVHCPIAPEPFGRIVAEAMAAGCAVVAARDGGLPEIVDDGSTGLLATPGDAANFAVGVLRLLEDAALRGTITRAARCTAEQRFRVDIHASRVFEVYDRLLALRAAA